MDGTRAPSFKIRKGPRQHALHAWLLQTWYMAGHHDSPMPHSIHIPTPQAAEGRLRLHHREDPASVPPCLALGGF